MADSNKVSTANDEDLAFSTDDSKAPLSPDRKHTSAGAAAATANNNNTNGDYSSSEGEAEEDATILPKGEIDPVYEEKARVLNHAIQEIGMGTYQYLLFVVIGFGWASDNLWPIVTSLILPPIALEFSPSRPPLLTLSQNLGLLVGAVFWGFGCDIFGRKWAFNLTLGITAVFGLAAAGAPSFGGICAFAALWSFGVGGNLPVDSAIFLEFLPRSHQWLLTVLSVFWAVAQVIATAIAWPLLGGKTCQEDQKGGGCDKSENMGWRWFMITVGGMTMLMFLVRFLLFQLHESPKYLMGKGRDEDAVRVVREVARRNGKSCSLTVEDLRRCEPEGYVQRTGAGEAVKRRLEDVKFDRVKALFRTRRMAWSTGLVMAIWAFIGLGYPLYNAFLPYIQASRGADFGDGSTYLTYRNSLIIASLGVPGALLGGWMVELPRFGRKGTLALSTVMTGAFLYASTTALDSTSLLGWNCAFNFTSNIMYAVLYSFTPELFPTPQRGTGNALSATCNRIFGIMAPIVAMYADLETAAPVYVSGALFLAAGVLVLLLPFESRGKAAL